MILEEVKALVETVSALCPAQKTNEFTAEAWHMILADVNATSALAAVKELGTTRRFIAPSDIVTWIEQDTSGAMQKAIIPAPDVNPDDPHAWLEAYRANVREVRRQIDAGLWKEPDVASDPAAYEAAMRRQRAMFGAAYAPPKAIEAAPTSGVDRPEEWLEMRGAMDGHGSDFMRRRAIANTVECTQPSCEAPVDRPCRMDGKTLTKQPAHWQRLVRAGLEKPLRPPISADKFKAMIDAGLIA